MNENITYIFQGTNYIDLTLYQYGREKCAPLLSCGPAVHNHYLLHYILEGKGFLPLVPIAIMRCMRDRPF